MDAVNINLEQGNPFFTTLYNNGVLVYDSNRVPLSVPVSSDTNKSFNEGNQRKFDLAQMFYETACDCATEGRNDVAVFMFHQAIELTCIALLRICLGYKPTTHSIKKLFMLIENVTPRRLNKYSPDQLMKKRSFFNILQRAYSDVRYKESYSVSGDKVFMLLERVHEFQVMALAICEENGINLKQLLPMEIKIQIPERVLRDVRIYGCLHTSFFGEVLWLMFYLMKM
ncbi:MAG: HEPN domain-containing protein [Flammeovirgaceae bacterium]|nr:HEPN domain-containing protein [Flammeovirgaceae bacterium]